MCFLPHAKNSQEKSGMLVNQHIYTLVYIILAYNILSLRMCVLFVKKEKKRRNNYVFSWRVDLVFRGVRAHPCIIVGYY
jgi:hypothetical protein